VIIFEFKEPAQKGVTMPLYCRRGQGGACQAENGFAAAEELTRIFAEADCEKMTDTHMYAICGQN